ncbi:MAG: pyruvate kinase [Candidatus Caenarcaniphilales bacterium]|nr:pyruvate kinase [Candidatus Caenarcaniphilales bacterium]
MVISPETFTVNRKAKIICTIGPATNNREMIRSLILAGMDVARLNFSHGTYDDHREVTKIIREVSAEIGKPVAILQDLQGPKIRTGKLKNGPITLTPGQEFTITTEQVESTESLVSTTYTELAKDLGPGNVILIDDGLLQLDVLESDGVKVKCKVIHGGLLKNNKGINIPDVKLTAPALTEKDKLDLQVGLECDVDYIALSFVREAKDVVELKELIQKAGKDTPIIAKIEKPQALRHINEILDVSDGIMVARGDLGVELTPEKVPVVQKKLIKKANEKGILVITATQMLESMIKNPCPTRAEASDVANAIFDNTDAVMLSGETASGNFPIEVVKMMARIIEETEKAISYPRKIYSDLEDEDPVSPKDPPGFVPSSISRLACEAAREVNATAVVVFTASGAAALRVSKCRSNCRVIALSPYPKIQRRMELYWAVQSAIINDELDTTETIEEVMNKVDEILLSTGIFKPGDVVIVTAGAPSPISGTANLLKIHTLGSQDSLIEIS